MLREFREFINRGNFVDIAVAFIIGVSFGVVVTTLVSRVISPAIALIIDVPDLSGVWTFGETGPDGQPTGSVGAFLEALLNFALIAFVMFLVVKAYNRVRAPAEPGEDQLTVLQEIRDQLAQPQQVVVMPETQASAASPTDAAAAPDPAPPSE